MDLQAVVAQLRSRGSDFPSVEVKAAAGGLPNSLTETLCAFGNLPGGGLVILGLDEAKGFEPVRLKSASTLAAGLASRSRQAFEPSLSIDVQVQQFEGADIVIATVTEVPPSVKPCIVKRTGKGYLRFADGDYTLSRLEIDGFVANRTRPRYDEAEAEGSTRSDLDADRLADFIATARSMDSRLRRVDDDDELLLKVGVISSAGKPTIAGVLALGQYPQQFLPQCNIRAALLTDDDVPSVRALDATTFTGPIAVILDDVSAWVTRNSRRRLLSDAATGSVREVQDPPLTAVRELVANALVHRDLAEWASSRAVELRMTGQSFRVTNPGGLYGISVDRLGVHPLTSARNRRLIEICKFVRTNDRNVVEALASGIPATLDSLRNAGMRPPSFFDQGLTFTATIHRGGTSVERAEMPVRVTARERELLVALVAPATVASLASTLGVTENAVHKRLASMRTKGLVAMSGGNGQRSVYRRAERPD